MRIMIIDIAIAAVLVFLVYEGIRKGFVRSLVDFVGSIASVAASILFARGIADLIAPYVQSVSLWGLQGALLTRILATVIFFAALEILVRFLAAVLDRVFHLPVLKQINQILGAAVGLFRGAVIAVLICAVLELAVAADTSSRYPALHQQSEQSVVLTYFRANNPISALLRPYTGNEVGRNEPA